ncbi:manganese efflux pump MntP [Alteromonas gilva]|uniref:Putative manganese efflux pump MntP n=1 Tax=Alteromonas gilva TaxID=2987522 RepID=A0ABT5L0I2_9ALTE|nr:manganese efflux pump MntP family protein [Alteromonas gilva]MDC8830538.1 manganese efflux pump MntP family protein [Alteromonas gilva]
MSIFALILLAFAMSTDAFAAAIGKGVKIKNPRLGFAIKIGLTFGLIEAITPIIGWLIGRAAATYVQAWDHWLALVILCGLGVYMIIESLQPVSDEESQSPKQSFVLLCVTACGTSIDAMAVGVGLALVDVNIAVAAALIGLATFSMVTIGIMLGSAMGSLIGKRAETFGGVVLIAVGMWIFASHTL